MIGTEQVIKELRKANKFTQEELAAILGVQKSSIQKYENSSIINLKLQTIRKLCELFRVPPYAFVFPEIWQMFSLESETEMEFLSLSSGYMNLSEEGRKKVLEYVEDIKENPKYRSGNMVTTNEVRATLLNIHYQMVANSRRQQEAENACDES